MDAVARRPLRACSARSLSVASGISGDSASARFGERRTPMSSTALAAAVGVGRSSTNTSAGTPCLRSVAVIGSPRSAPYLKPSIRSGALNTIAMPALWVRAVLSRSTRGTRWNA